jgi:hypothetical protein
MIRTRLTYANVVASLALFIALGGTSVAATSLISGAKIKKNSIPANRIKKRSLTATQVDVAKLGTVPAATKAGHADSATTATTAATATTAGSANSATNATHAGSAVTATHATDADTVGGLAPASFMPAGRVVAGSASTDASTVETFLDSPLGFRLETDGVAGIDQAVTLRNTGSKVLGVVGSGATLVGVGATRVVTVAGSPLTSASTLELRFIVQDATAPSKEALVNCFFPNAGAGGVRALCTAVHTTF